MFLTLVLFLESLIQFMIEPNISSQPGQVKIRSKGSDLVSLAIFLLKSFLVQECI